MTRVGDEQGVERGEVGANKESQSLWPRERAGGQ